MSSLDAIIERKQRGEEHSAEELAALVDGYVSDRIDDIRMTSWLRAVMVAGMSLDETVWLTEAMARSGETIGWANVIGTVVDKHSTGGVSDGVSLIAVPLAAACGVRVAKLSGRALGHTGGTLDKLECIPGLSTSLSTAAFKRQVADIGCAIAATSEQFAPADKKIYELRHRTQTIASIPLIAASVMSKKLAGGAPYLVIDVKCGRSAFMRTQGEAVALADTLLHVGARLGRTVSVLVTDMDSPLGTCIGNALELDEALRVLQGHERGRLFAVSLEVAQAMLGVRHETSGPLEARYQEVLRHALRGGSAYERFAAMAETQGGKLAALRRPDEPAGIVHAARSGALARIDGQALGLAVSRAQKEDTGFATGIRLLKGEGDAVISGEPLAEIFGSGDAAVLAQAASQALEIRDHHTPAQAPVIMRLHAAAAEGS